MNKPQWLMWEGALSAEQCDMIIEKCRANLTTLEAETFGGKADGRQTDISWIPDEGEFAEIHELMRGYAHLANESFGVELTNLPPIQFTEYADVGHHYDWHHDINWSRNDGKHRKLSIVIQLSDEETYEGGEFSFRYIENPKPESVIKRGTIICFLPYHYHAITPILKGTRASLVGWYEGPEWK